MKGDFSRLTFDVTKHFSRVLMQQGRVQLDADWNEQTAILLHYLQTLAKDLIGEHGGPADIVDSTNNVLKRNLGFEIIVDPNRVEKFLELSDEQKTALKNLISSSKPPIVIGKGHYYVDGILCENDQDKSFSNQLDYPWPKGKNLDPNNYLVFLDFWERHISYIEDDSIREVALGGPDTTTRVKLIGQVKIINKYWEKKEDGTYEEKDIPESPDNWRVWISSNWSGWLDQWQPANRGLLKALAKQDRKKDDDPCITSPESSYRGAENQLYRVEIHKHGIAWNGKNDATSNKESAATFKWSPDNGSVVTRGKLNGTELTVDNPRGLSEGKWLELTNDNQELRGEPGVMAKIKAIECDTVTLEFTGTDNEPKVPQEEVWPTKARLWESDSIPITESDKNTDKDWHKLENGVQIQFQPSTPANHYRTGDYWLIPARVATGDVEWLGDEGKPEALPPHGVEHHYAPLAIIQITNNGAVNKMAELRKEFEPLANDI